jgi:large subunit ribosomal protein L10
MKGRKEPRKEKIEAVEKLTAEIKSYPVIGVLNLYKTPANALQKIKKELKGKAVIKVAKKSILLFALVNAFKHRSFQIIFIFAKKENSCFCKAGRHTNK